METADQILRLDKPPEVISYNTMRRAIGILGITLPLILVFGSSLFGGCIFVLGVAFLPCNASASGNSCLVPAAVVAA